MTSPLRRVARIRIAAVAAIAALALTLAPSATAGTASAAPTPAEQSDQPAPASRSKTVVPNVHTDAISTFIDDGRLVLETKVDMDVTGDGIPEVGHRLDPDAVLFHLSDAGRLTVPDVPGYGFLGQPGDTIWMAPQTQIAAVIWPGFSTEHPGLAGRVQDNRFAVRMTDVRGPGDVEVYLQRGTAIDRIFSSTTELPAWTINVPQHAHMNWAFLEPGTYTVTFEMTGVVDGRPQVATNDYVFVVGDLAAHTRDTQMMVAADSDEVDPGEPVLLTAHVTPADAAGAAQFRDLTTGAILGHTAVRDGSAKFRADALAPGDHRLVAEFVPLYGDDHRPSVSHPVTISVTGEASPRPTEDDLVPVPDADLAAHPAGSAVVVSTTGKAVNAGGTLSARVTDGTSGGQWVSVWIPGDAPAWKGWAQTNLRGELSVATGSAIPSGDQRLIVKTRDGGLLGWDTFTVTASPSPPIDPGAPPAALPQQPPTQAAPQDCQPALTLETGHIDAFYVSAANGRAVLQMMEDVTGHRVVREPEQVLLRVKPSAYRADIPAGTPGAPAGYVLPLTQNPSLIWPGWDTNRTASSGHSDVSIHITGVSGPGRVHLSSQGSFGNVTSLLQSGGYSLPGIIREEVPAHTHAQWVFSAEGIYTLTAHAVATNPSTAESVRTATRTYTFQVGDVPLGDTFCQLSAVDVADSAAIHAAVNRAAADAVAAAQAEAEAAAAEAEKVESRRQVTTSKRDASSEGALAATQPAPSPAVVTGLIGGGALIIAGIVGATFWYVRRVGAPPGPGLPRA